MAGPLLATAATAREALRHPVRRFVGEGRERLETTVSVALVEGLRRRRSLRDALDDAAVAVRALRP